LKYTIYQAAASVREVEKIVNHEEPGNEIFVLQDGKQLAGYYHAILSDKEYQLNYIAVRPDVRSRGLGSSLLRHFHEQALTRGCVQTSLDVFASNPKAHSWYEKEGYRPDRESWLCRFMASRPAPAPTCELICDSPATTTALEIERKFGFSKMPCECSGNLLTVGLIAGHTCRLLDSVVPIEQIASALMRWEKLHRREILIAWWPGLPDSEWPLVSTELSIRMLRAVEADRS
jgi:GNAT superfamily N-acetyltransferase